MGLNYLWWWVGMIESLAVIARFICRCAIIIIWRRRRRVVIDGWGTGKRLSVGSVALRWGVVGGAMRRLLSGTKRPRG